MRRWSGWGVLVVLLAGLVVWLPSWLPVQQVQVEGPFQQVVDAEVLQAIQNNLSAQPLLLTLDLAAIQQAVQRLPWVNQVLVSRQWPATLRLVFSESRAVARWQRGLLDAQGQPIVRDPRRQWAELPELVCQERQLPQAWQWWQRMQQDMLPMQRAIRRVQLTVGGSMNMRLDDGTQLYLGEKNWDQRWRRWLRVYPDLRRDGRVIRRVDLRYQDGFAVAWKKSETVDQRGKQK